MSGEIKHRVNMIRLGLEKRGEMPGVGTIYWLLESLTEQLETVRLKSALLEASESEVEELKVSLKTFKDRVIVAINSVADE